MILNFKENTKIEFQHFMDIYKEKVLIVNKKEKKRELHQKIQIFDLTNGQMVILKIYQFNLCQSE